MRIFITFWIALILISKIFLLFFNQGVSLIDDFFVLFCFYFFLKELFNHDRKRLSFLISFFIWLSATFTISVFLGSKGYISSVLVYLKPIVFITGILVFMRKEYIDFRMIEVIIIISSLYGILQFLIYLFFGYIMPGGGQALHHIGGRWFLRVGGMSGHPNIYGMLLFPFVPVFFCKEKIR